MSDRHRPSLRSLAPRIPRTRLPVEAAAGTPTAQSRRPSFVAGGIYVDGERTASPHNLVQAFADLRARPGALAWVGLCRPSPAELTAMAPELRLHELALEDAIQAHQRPKLERYGATLFVVLHAAAYDDAHEQIEFGELHVFVGPDVVVTVRHAGSPDLTAVRQRLEADQNLLRNGAEAVLYAILDAVVDGYLPVVAGLENDVREIETEVFDGAPQASRRIYELLREVVEFQRAVLPLHDMIAQLSAGFTKYTVHEELQRYLRDVADHVTAIAERVESARTLLRDVLTISSILLSQRQNEEMRALTEASYQQAEEVKKISSWAAILFAPTLVGTVYGMNFDRMPELHWAAGYPFALALMATVCATLFIVFRHRNWL